MPGSTRGRRTARMLGYVVAVLLAVAALLANLLLEPWVHANTFPLFYVAVMVSTWYAGLGPGLLATGLSTLANAVFFIGPSSDVGVLSPAGLVRLGLYAAAALLIAGLAGALRAAQRGAEARAVEARRHEEALRQSDAALRASEARFRGLVESAPDGIVIVDGDGRIVLVNTEGNTLFGYTGDELVGWSVEALLPEALRHRHAGHRAGYQAHPATRPMGLGLDLVGRRKDGSEFPVEISLSPMQAQEGVLVISVIRDITERKKIEARVKALNETLAQRVAELAAVNRELEAFSYSVSHDLRAPLRGIDGFSQALLEEYGERLDETAQDYLRRIRAATQRMGDLIDDLLDLSRVTRREMRRERVDVTALAHAVAAQLQKSEPDRIVEWSIAEGVHVSADPALLRIVLENLLGNAWKFTGKEPTARIGFGCSEQNGTPVFFVADNGVGFDMAYATKLFGAFQRLHGVNEFPGTGIGLATVQRIVHRHGGRVWGEAEPGKGATFFFTLRPDR